MEDNLFARIAVIRDWEKARQTALIEDVVSLLTFRQASELLSFDEVRKKLRLSQRNYRGIQEVSLGQIRGSVGRHKDFTGSFMPRTSTLKERWVRVGTAAGAQGLAPVELYQVGDAYFVLDGNHRVSVARQSGAQTIQAHVWEFATPVGLSADADLQELLIKEEYASFLEHTRLDKLRPEASIQFTEPGNYHELEYQIALYQQVIEKIDGEPCSHEDAVTAWYDMIYTPATQIIQQRNVLERFPGHTEADVYVWVWHHHQMLRKQGVPSLATAVDNMPEGRSLLGWLCDKIRRLGGQADA